jgi:hypothetical protein
MNGHGKCMNGLRIWGICPGENFTQVQASMSAKYEARLGKVSLVCISAGRTGPNMCERLFFDFKGRATGPFDTLLYTCPKCLLIETYLPEHTARAWAI